MNTLLSNNLLSIPGKENKKDYYALRDRSRSPPQRLGIDIPVSDRSERNSNNNNYNNNINYNYNGPAANMN